MNDVFARDTVENTQQASQLNSFGRAAPAPVAQRFREVGGYPTIVRSWRNNWARLTSFFDHPPEIRRIIDTTNAIDSVNMSLRKITKNRGAFSSDDALVKLFYLALANISKKWKMPLRDWKAALTRFTIQFEERMPKN